MRLYSSCCTPEWLHVDQDAEEPVVADSSGPEEDDDGEESCATLCKMRIPCLKSGRPKSFFGKEGHCHKVSYTFATLRGT